MKRNDFSVDLILSADWHIMEKTKQPVCRTDNYWKTQWDKVNQILELQEKYDCPIELAGDFFETWKASPELINKCISVFFGKEIYTIIGNHDAPQHNTELMHKSAWQTLLLSSCFMYSKNQLDWETKLEKAKYKIFRKKRVKRKIVIAHIMAWQGKMPWPRCTDPHVGQIFGMFPDADLIVTGHNHKTFIAKKGKQLLVNPGSLTRHKADQIDHKPCVFLWDAGKNKIKRHFLKIKKDVISREHIDVKKEKDKRIDAFISKLKKSNDIDLSFENSLKKALQQNKSLKKYEKIIYNWLDDVEK